MTPTQIKKLPHAADARGVVFEPLVSSQLPGQQHAHVVLTEPGRIRGNHWHRRGTEIAVVTGPASVRLREQGALREVQVPADEVWQFTIPAGVSHAFQAGDRLMVLVAFSTEPYDPLHPDVVRDALFETP